MMLDLSPKKRDRVFFGNGFTIAERFIEEPSQKEKEHTADS